MLSLEGEAARFLPLALALFSLDSLSSSGFFASFLVCFDCVLGCSLALACCLDFGSSLVFCCVFVLVSVFG